MAISTRDAKDWLEATLLDDDTMGGVTPSDTDVVSQDSIKTYVDAADATTLSSAQSYADALIVDDDDFDPVADDKAPSQESTKQYIADQIDAITGIPSFVFTEVDSNDDPLALSFGDVIHIDDITDNPLTLNLPEITSSDYGKRLFIAVSRFSGVLTLSPHAGNEIYGEASFAMDGSVFLGYHMINLVAIEGGATPTWITVHTPNKIVFGYLPIYADNAAAKTGGLSDGDVYRTATGQLMVVYT